MKVTKQFTTETAHRLMDHPGRCKNIHGHSYLWEVSVEMPGTNKNGMVIDFGDLKKLCHPIIDEYDHALVLQDTDPLLDMFTKQGGQRLYIFEGPPTAERMCETVAKELSDLMGDAKITVRLWETATSFAEFTCLGGFPEDEQV